jgi:hypothetical protein
MNIEFLESEIIPQREKEIANGKDAWWTKDPIYVVYDLTEHVTTYDSEYSFCCTLSEKENEHGRYVCYDEDGGIINEWEEWYESEYSEFIEDYDNPEITRFFCDRFVAVFFTRKAAEEYMQYQSHNLSDNAFIYVHNVWYSNYEMDNLLTSKK